MDREAQNVKGAAAFWSSETNKRRDFAHWRGVGRWTDKVWVESGESNYRAFQLLRAKYAHGGCMQRMIEWGPGGGANVAAFGRQFHRIHGVDISAATLDKCHEQAAKRKTDDYGCKFRFVGQVIAPDNPESFVGHGPFDFMLCTAVVQHMPSKAWVGRFLKATASEMREGGQALVEFKIPGRTIGRRLNNGWDGAGEYASNVARWCVFHSAEFVDLCEASGWRVLEKPCKPVESEMRYGLMIYLERA